MAEKFKRTITIGQSGTSYRRHFRMIRAVEFVNPEICVAGDVPTEPTSAAILQPYLPLPKTGNMTLRPHSIVHSILYDDKKGKAIGVKVLDAETKQEMDFFRQDYFSQCINPGKYIHYAELCFAAGFLTDWVMEAISLVVT